MPAGVGCVDSAAAGGGPSGSRMVSCVAECHLGTDAASPEGIWTVEVVIGCNGGPAVVLTIYGSVNGVVCRLNDSVVPVCTGWENSEGTDCIACEEGTDRDP